MNDLTEIKHRSQLKLIGKINNRIRNHKLFAGTFFAEN